MMPSYSVMLAYISKRMEGGQEFFDEVQEQIRINGGMDAIAPKYKTCILQNFCVIRFEEKEAEREREGMLFL
jgi:hypothetical protein